LWNTARDEFEEAASLLRKAPDPWLGLVWLYAYVFKDVEKTEEALREADNRGHRLGKRETAQLADVYRDRGERIMREAEDALGHPQERKYLERAAKDFDRARELYESILPFAGSPASLRRVFDHSDLIARRKLEIEEENR
jgi:hypothetical protein